MQAPLHKFVRKLLADRPKAQKLMLALFLNERSTRVRFLTVDGQKYRLVRMGERNLTPPVKP